MKVEKKRKKDKPSDLDKVVAENEDLRMKVSSLVTQIDLLMSGKTPEEANLSLNNILDDLPINQQINLYQDSIAELKYKMPTLKLESIEKIEREIRARNEVLFQLKQQEETLRKVSSNHSRVMKNLNKNKTKSLVKELTENIREKKAHYKDLRAILKQDENTIKQQNNSIFILQDNCNFIQENIEYKKGNTEKQKRQESVELFEMEQNAKKLENLIYSEEDGYKMEISKQNQQIDDLTEEIQIISLVINDVLQRQRIAELKEKARRNQQRKSKANTTASNKNTDSLFVEDESQLLNEILKDTMTKKETELDDDDDRELFNYKFTKNAEAEKLIESTFK